MANALKQKTIVIVDDDPLIVDLVTSYFAPLNVVYGYSSAEFAQQMLPQLGLIDLFIIDFILPGMNGIELFQDLRPKYPTAKFICISGELNIEMAEKGSSLGFDAMMMKPFDLSMLEENALQLVAG
jgi:two-component system response regulator GlrR